MPRWLFNITSFGAFIPTQYTVHLLLGFIATAKLKAQPEKIAAFGDTLLNVAMVALAMNEVIFPAMTGVPRAKKTPSSRTRSFHQMSSVGFTAA